MIITMNTQISDTINNSDILLLNQIQNHMNGEPKKG